MAHVSVSADNDLLQMAMNSLRVEDASVAVNVALIALLDESRRPEQALAMQGAGWEGTLQEMRGGRIVGS